MRPPSRYSRPLRGRLWRCAPDEGAPGPDDGFTIVETIVAITIIMIVMGAMTFLFVTVMSSSGHARSAQAATQLASVDLDEARGLGAAGAVSGRDQTSVQSQFAAAPATVQPWLATAQMTQASDPTAAANAGYTAALPTKAVTQTLDNASFSVNYYVGYCNQATGATSCTATAGGVAYVRVVIAVSWKDQTCSTTSCVFVTAGLISRGSDPIFDLNQAPPPTPVINTIANQTSAVGDTVTGPSATTSAGVPPFSWTATGLPPGLAMSSAGVVTGTPTTTTGSPFTVSVTVTDGFQDQSATTFTWTIVPTLKVTDPGAQTGTAGKSLSLTLAATGGTGTGYTWKATGLPAGLSLNASTGVISGTPTAAAAAASPYATTVTVTDSSGTRSATDTFTWSINYAALAPTTPANQSSTVNRPATTVSLSASGGSGSYSWSDPSGSLPAGISISGSTLTGTPTKAGTYTVKLVLSDSASNVPNNPASVSSFTWTVNATPTVTGPGNQTVEIGAAVSGITATASGGTGSYTWTASSLPAGLSINATSGAITGTPTSKATSGTSTVTVTDSLGGTASKTVTWTVVAATTASNPAAYQTTTNYKTSVSLGFAQFVTTGGSGVTVSSYKLTSGSLPTGLSLNTSTGVISGTTNSTRSSAGVTVTVTDSLGGTATISFTWYVDNLTWSSSIANQTTQHGKAATSLNLANYDTGGSSSTDSYTVTGTYVGTSTGLPAGLTMSTAGVISGTVSTTATTGTYTITVTSTDTSGTAKGATIMQQFTWTVT